MVNRANDAIGKIIPKSERDNPAPWVCGENDETYGEIVYFNPDAAPVIDGSVTEVISNCQTSNIPRQWPKNS